MLWASRLTNFDDSKNKMEFFSYCGLTNFDNSKVQQLGIYLLDATGKLFD